MLIINVDYFSSFSSFFFFLSFLLTHLVHAHNLSANDKASRGRTNTDRMRSNFFVGVSLGVCPIGVSSRRVVNIVMSGNML